MTNVLIPCPSCLSLLNTHDPSSDRYYCPHCGIEIDDDSMVTIEHLIDWNELLDVSKEDL